MIGLTVQLVKRYLPNSEATAKGHIYQARNICGQQIPEMNIIQEKLKSTKLERSPTWRSKTQK